MANSTKYLLAEQVQTRLAGGYRDASQPVQNVDIVKAIEQIINSMFQMQYYNATLPTGETIPDNLMIAFYENIAVTTFGDKSQAELPIIPISLPRNMGVYRVTDNKDNDFIPVPLGQGALLKADKLLNDLLGNVWFEIRKNVLKFDQVLNQQREVIYKWRRNLLTSDDISDLLNEWFQDIKENVSQNVELHKKSYESLEHFKDQVDEELNELLSEDNKNELLSNLKIDDSLNIGENLEALFIKNEQKDSMNFWNLARAAALSFIDQTWKNHLSEMDYLRSGIGLRAMGQRDPLVEYQKEGYDLFEELIFNVKTSVVRLLLNFDGIAVSSAQKTKANPSNLESNDEGSKDFGKIGRNDPCPCGSGKKYKKCKMVNLCSKN